ncbi:hypothetical protein TorRG33x02_226370 [Trema orientale]|uniref:Uncharacterized protein n=1 Tax=Trema orientale TaxID=63057 RepID=A0A2P5E7S9_TREOI|nr:hypothetical protein TorRG33x02_226370 [Trema orientale]
MIEDSTLKYSRLFPNDHLEEFDKDKLDDSELLIQEVNGSIVENGEVKLDNEVILPFSFPIFEFIVDGDVKEISTKDNFESDGVVLDFDLEQQVGYESKSQIEEIGRQMSHNLLCGLENNKEESASYSIYLNPRSLYVNFFNGISSFLDLLFL